MKLFKIFMVKPIATNCYLLKEGDDYYLIDCGVETEKIIEYLNVNQIKLTAILITHVHFDHVYGIQALHEYDNNIDIYIPDEEIPLLYDKGLLKELEESFNIQINITAPVKELSKFTGEFLEVRYISGHSKKSAVFVDHENKNIFAGDTLFFNNIGRSDFIYGNYDSLIRGIKEELLSLTDEYKVYPGHGLKTTIGYERKNNIHLLRGEE